MSRDNLDSKQKIVVYNCLTKIESNHKTHIQTIGYIRTRRQTRKKTIKTKQKQIIKKRFSKRRNAVSESETNTTQELQDLKESIKNITR